MTGLDGSLQTLSACTVAVLKREEKNKGLIGNGIADGNETVGIRNRWQSCQSVKIVCQGISIRLDGMFPIPRLAKPHYPNPFSSCAARCLFPKERG